MSDLDRDSALLDYARQSTRADNNAGGGALHVIAILTACATFPLIFMGGLVTSHQAGMSVPDWPNSYGYNMFLFPPRLWIGGILYEHTHRLMGTVVGMLSIALVIASFTSKWAGKRERILAVVVLAAVIFQGVLGGLRVVLVKLDLAIVHACVAQAFFCLAAFAAVSTSRWWHQFHEMHSREEGHGRWLVLLGIVTVAAIYAQLMVGATMRHYQAGLAIPDLPLAYGKLLPPMNQSQLDAANWVRVRELNLDPVTWGQVWLHFGHRLGAIVVTLLVAGLSWTTISRHTSGPKWLRPTLPLIGLGAIVVPPLVAGLAWATIRHYATQPKLVWPALLLIALLAAQLTLGVLTVLYRKPADVASAHVAVGALVLVTTFVLTARAARLYGIRREAPVDRTAAMELAGTRT